MRALVTGGGGFLGKAITRQLLDRGDEVTILARGAYPDVEGWGARSVRADLADAAALAAALGPVLRDIDVVFHVAARPGVWGPRAEYFSANFDGTVNLLDLAAAAGVRRFVHTSTPAVAFDGRDHQGSNEVECGYATTFLTAYAESKAAAEKHVLAGNGPDLATTALRPHLIVGPGDPNLLPRLIDRHRQGRLVRVGDGATKVGLTYIDNAAVAHLQAADALAPGSANAGKPYFITDDEPVVLWDWIDRLLAALELPPLIRHISAANARRLGRSLEWAWRTLRRPGEPPMTDFVAQQLSSHHWYDLSAARADFGYKTLVDGEEAFQRTVDALRAR